MSWMREHDEPPRYGLVLVPTPAAMVQDLGPFRSGRLLEADILPRSALVCASDKGRPVVGDDGMVKFTFEGNANGAVNLTTFHERCLSAAGRLAQRQPSIAYGRAHPKELRPFAEMDLLRYVFTRMIDAAALEEWSAEKVSDYLPPEDLETPTADPAVTTALCRLPMRSLSQGRMGIFAWLLFDGTILTKGEADAQPVTAWRSGDRGLAEVLDEAGVDLAKRMMLAPG